MSNQLPRTIPAMADEMREKIISEPELILDDADVMRALVAATEKHAGSNVVDLRGLAMERLEDRLDRLEYTHRGVIAAAYENLAGTNQIHRAVLQLLEAPDFTSFLTTLTGDMADMLRLDAVRLMLETDAEDTALPPGLSDVVLTAEPGFIDNYITLGRNIPARSVTLRQITPEDNVIYGVATGLIHSEALMKLDLGAGRLPGLLVFGAEDPHLFSPTQGTDLLTFFAGAFERMMRRWLG